MTEEQQIALLSMLIEAYKLGYIDAKNNTESTVSALTDIVKDIAHETDLPMFMNKQAH